MPLSPPSTPKASCILYENPLVDEEFHMRAIEQHIFLYMFLIHKD